MPAPAETAGGADEGPVALGSAGAGLVVVTSEGSVPLDTVGTLEGSGTADPAEPVASGEAFAPEGFVPAGLEAVVGALLPPPLGKTSGQTKVYTENPAAPTSTAAPSHFPIPIPTAPLDAPFVLIFRGRGARRV